MYKAIIFDVGGVLHSNKIKYVYRDIKHTLKLTEKAFNNSYKKIVPLLQIGKISEDNFWKKVIKMSNTKEPLPDTSLLLREYSKRFKIHKEVLSLVKKLKKKRYKLAILSNTVEPHVIYCKNVGLYNDFRVTIFSNAVGLIKPDPRIYKLAIKKLGFEPEDIIFVDDVLDYVEAANKLGIKGLLFTSAEKLNEDLEQLNVI